MTIDNNGLIGSSIAAPEPDYKLITRANNRATKDYQLNPEDATPPHVLTSSNLKDHLEPMKPLLDVARFGTEYLFNQVKGAGYVLLLTDAQGVTVDFFNNHLVDQELKNAGLFLGSCWSEEREGTCAVGVALAEKTAVTVHKDEHYRIINKGLTCSSSPIFAPNGDLLAILDASALQSPDDKRSQYLILEMVKSTARMIENANFLRINEQNIIIRISSRHAFLEVSTEGLIALSQDGFILAANQYLFQLLNLSPAHLIGKHIDAIFDVTIDRLLKAARFEREPISLRSWTTNNLCFACVSLPKIKKSAGKVIDLTLGEPVTKIEKLAGTDISMAANAKQVLRVIDKGLSILLLGESGTGKEAFAKAIHEVSDRSREPFVGLNCAAIPETLIESELFGYKEGAFTGAKSRGATGKILQANNGTLFLDEIGDMPLSLQTRLLRVLAEKEITPLGSNTPIPVNLQVICATHQNLPESVKSGHFRLDLYYRIAGLTITLPRLQDRSDKLILIKNILEAEAQDLDKATPELDTGVEDILLSYSWPGNIRELKNVLRSSIILCDDDLIKLEDLPTTVTSEKNASCAHIQVENNSNELLSDKHKSKKNLLIEALTRNHWNVTVTAQELNASRASIYRWMDRYNLVPPNQRT